MLGIRDVCSLRVYACSEGTKAGYKRVTLRFAEWYDRCMFAETLSPAAVQTFYNRLGTRHDAADWYEGAAKRCALAALALRPGQRVLNVGVGTGKEHYQIMTAVGPLGLAVGLDLATVMLALTRARTGTPLLRADARTLPLLDGVFDRVYAAYILDLIPLADLPGMLHELRRVLRPVGRRCWCR